MYKLIQLKNYIMNCFAFVLVAAIFSACPEHSFAETIDNVLIGDNSEGQVLYLSDILYSKAEVGWGNIAFDKTQDNASFVMNVEGMSVVVKLVSPSKEITIINNDGKDTYTFTNNGTFTFEFVDRAGNKGAATAVVNWIDKEVPTVELKYDKTNSKKVIVSIINPSEEIIFENGTGIYEFDKNGTYELTFKDKVGNIGKVIAIVDWLKEDLPVEPEQPDNNKEEEKPNHNGNQLEEEPKKNSLIVPVVAISTVVVLGIGFMVVKK